MYVKIIQKLLLRHWLEMITSLLIDDSFLKRQKTRYCVKKHFQILHADYSKTTEFSNKPFVEFDRSTFLDAVWAELWFNSGRIYIFLIRITPQLPHFQTHRFCFCFHHGIFEVNIWLVKTIFFWFQVCRFKRNK